MKFDSILFDVKKIFRTCLVDMFGSRSRFDMRFSSIMWTRLKDLRHCQFCVSIQASCNFTFRGIARSLFKRLMPIDYAIIINFKMESSERLTSFT